MERNHGLTIRVTETENNELQRMAEAIGYGSTPAGIVYQLIQNAVTRQTVNPLHTRRVWDSESESLGQPDDDATTGLHSDIADLSPDGRYQS